MEGLQKIHIIYISLSPQSEHFHTNPQQELEGSFQGTRKHYANLSFNYLGTTATTLLVDMGDAPSFLSISFAFLAQELRIGGFRRRRRGEKGGGQPKESAPSRRKQITHGWQRFFSALTNFDAMFKLIQ